MNKKLLTGCTAICMVLFASAQKPAKLFNELGLKGAVKSLSERTFEALENFGKPEKGERGAENGDYTFLRNGDIAEQNIYNQNGSLRARHVYVYDASGKLTEQNVYAKGGPLKMRFRYKYHNNGLLSEQRTIKPDGTMASRYTYDYDRKNNLTIYKVLDEKGRQAEKTIYSYDSANNQLGWISYDADSSLVMSAEYGYNLYGYLTEENLYNAVGRIEKRALMVYDINGRMSAMTEYADKNEMIKTIQYRYDAQDNITDEIWYDKENNILDHYTNKYTYDKNKNWTRKLILRNDVPIKIIERELAYFK